MPDRIQRISKDPSAGQEEPTARILWAAHILHYLTKNRSHIGLPQPDDADEEEGLEHGDLDAETERTTILQGGRESIRRMFLDCVSQLLSPSRGWENVTAAALREREDFVEIDVARNDGFGIARSSRPAQHVRDFGGAEATYYRALRNYLSTGTQQGKVFQLCPEMRPSKHCFYSTAERFRTHRDSVYWRKGGPLGKATPSAPYTRVRSPGPGRPTLL